MNNLEFFKMYDVKSREELDLNSMNDQLIKILHVKSECKLLGVGVVCHISDLKTLLDIKTGINIIKTSYNNDLPDHYQVLAGEYGFELEFKVF